MKQENLISPAMVRLWESYLPRDSGVISIDEKLRCLMKIAFANLIPPQNIRRLIIKELQDEKYDLPL
jgi:hypothetical protein